MGVKAGLKITLARWCFECDGWFAIFHHELHIAHHVDAARSLDDCLRHPRLGISGSRLSQGYCCDGPIFLGRRNSLTKTMRNALSPDAEMQPH